MIPVNSKDNVKKFEIIINRVFLIAIIIVSFFIGRYSVPIEKEIDVGLMVVEDKQDPIIQELIDGISMFDDLPYDNDLTRLEELKKGKR